MTDSWNHARRKNKGGGRTPFGKSVSFMHSGSNRIIYVEIDGRKENRGNYVSSSSFF